MLNVQQLRKRLSYSPMREHIKTTKFFVTLHRCQITQIICGIFLILLPHLYVKATNLAPDTGSLECLDTIRKIFGYCLLHKHANRFRLLNQMLSDSIFYRKFLQMSLTARWTTDRMYKLFYINLWRNKYIILVWVYIDFNWISHDSSTQFDYSETDGT